MYVLSPFISVLCHSDWLFHGEACPLFDVPPGHAWSSLAAWTWHCSLHYLSPGNSHVTSWCDRSILASLLCCAWPVDARHDVTGSTRSVQFIGCERALRRVRVCTTALAVGVFNQARSRRSPAISTNARWLHRPTDWRMACCIRVISMSPFLDCLLVVVRTQKRRRRPRKLCIDV